MRQRNFPWAIIAAAAVAGAGFAGVANYVRHDAAKPSVAGGPDTDVTGGTLGKDALSGSNNAPVKIVDANNPDLQVTKGSKVAALTKALKEKTFDLKGIRVLDVTVDNGNAIVDMNNAVRYGWGSEEESEFISTMKETLAKYDTIKTFQIRVDGEILKYLSHFEINPVTVR
jgi:hypothetical protein